MGAWVYCVNMPGYLPDVDPVAFSSADEAMEYAVHDLLWRADADELRGDAWDAAAQDVNATNVEDCGGWCYVVCSDEPNDLGFCVSISWEPDADAEFGEEGWQ